MIKTLNITLISLCGFFAWCLLSLCIVSGQPVSSVLVTDVILYALWCVALSVSRNLRSVAVAVVLICALIQSFLVFFQFFDILGSRHSLFPVTGFMGNPGLMGGFQAIAMVIGLHYIKHSSSSKMRIVLIVLSAIYLFTMLASDSRAAVVGCLVGVITIFWDKLKNIINRYRWLVIGVMLAALGLSVGLYFYRPASVDARLLIWRVGVDMFMESPIYGQGLSMFAHRYMNCQAEYFLSHPTSPFVSVADNAAYPYSDLLRVVLELGLIGMVLVLMVLVIPLAVRADNSIKAPLVTYLVFSLFSYPSYDTIMSLCFPVLLFFPFCSDESRGKRYRLLFITLLLMLTLCGYRHYNVTERLYSHDEKELKLELQKVKDWYLIPRYNIVLSELFESGSSLYPDMIGYLRPTCENYCLIGDYLCRKQNNAAAEGYYSRASEMIPTRMTPLYKLWKLYMYENRYVKIENEYSIRRVSINSRPLTRSEKNQEIEKVDAERLNKVKELLSADQYLKWYEVYLVNEAYRKSQK